VTPRVARVSCLRMRSLLPLLVLAAACAGEAPEEPFVVVTFNTGTTEGLPHESDLSDGYGDAQAALSDAHYGDGLAWTAAIDGTRRFLAEVDPDVLAFQEIFYSGECPSVPDDARAGFVCETWREGDPTVALTLLGGGYQVACHQGKSDKCLAVKRSFGTFEGCDADLCLDHLAGARVPDCGGGSRVGRGVILRADGTRLTVVNVHGSSGVTLEDQGCRVQQFEQVFTALEAGTDAAANGERNVVLGDLNTDPGRLAGGDASADRFNALAAERGFAFHTQVGRDAPGSYADFFDIDHVLSDAFDGECWIAGIDERPEVLDFTYFDHRPVVCALTER